MPELRRRDFLKTAGAVGGASMISAGSTTLTAHAQPGGGVSIATSVKGQRVARAQAVDEIFLFAGTPNASQIRAVAVPNTYPAGRAAGHLPMERMQ